MADAVRPILTNQERAVEDMAINLSDLRQEFRLLLQNRTPHRAD
jgi:hypothetical protein